MRAKGPGANCTFYGRIYRFIFSIMVRDKRSVVLSTHSIVVQIEIG
jgi:hypothetical protein